ncbi:MAG: M12 family metallopeptidase [Methanotrichaceae archaeon]|nr:M12 family metallopeptidase [Methanotrichaceae archaeon]
MSKDVSATEGEGLQTEDVRKGFIGGVTFTLRPVEYCVVDGRAMFEGDIVLGTAEQMEEGKSEVARMGDAEETALRGVIITGQRFRWPNGIVPYTIASGFPNKRRVIDAISHWHHNTLIRFVERTDQNAGQYPNYVNFISADGCWSYVGMQGNRQDLSLGDGCSTGNGIHEIGHTVGLWHEHSREDRNRFVEVRYENIISNRVHNFDQNIADGDDVGNYDYGSVMHYPTHAFSKNGRPTIVPLQQGVTIGQRNNLSEGDIDAVKAMYKRTNFVSVFDFLGAYAGEYDGRRAALEITYTGEPSNPKFQLKFTELERNEVYVGTCTSSSGPKHVLSNITLQKQGGQGSVSWRSLYLHTWNINYLSGVSLWSGKEYGMSFRRK